jgi:hypothetical protein
MAVTNIDQIADVVRFGDCVVMGVGVTPERYRLLLQDAADQDYVVIGPKDSTDAGFIATKMKGERIEPQSLSVAGQELDVYLVRLDRIGGQSSHKEKTTI